MSLRSPAFSDHAPIPSRYSHEQGDVSPPLVWSGIPDDAVELVLVCEDPDAPGRGFVHWLLAGIPPGDGEIEAGTQPANAVAGRNGFGRPGYGGPHPPPGDKPHRYSFRLYALPDHSDLSPGFTADELAPLCDKALTAATLVGTWNR